MEFELLSPLACEKRSNSVGLLYLDIRIPPVIDFGEIDPVHAIMDIECSHPFILIVSSLYCNTRKYH